MRLKIPSMVILVALAILVSLAANLREVIANMPRVRVGSLHRSQPTGDALRLFVLGNAGTGREAQLKVAEAMEARCRAFGADAILLLGNNFHHSGVDSLHDPQWREKILQPYGSECLEKLPLYPVLGHYDYKGNPTAQVEFSLLNQRWRMPNRFYSVAFGKIAQVIAFDSQLAEFCFNPAFCAVDFLLEKTNAPQTAWTLVMSHDPLASQKVRGRGPWLRMRGLFLKPLLCQRADVWLAGRSHHLEHRRFAGCRLEHFISGGGGADLYELIRPNDAGVAFAEATHGYLELLLTATKLEARFFNQDGLSLYETSRTR